MFSQTTEYALRAMVWLAENEGEPQTTQQIAAATQAPAGYLSKVLQSLGRSGLVRASRGLHGGFELSRPATRTTIIDIVNVVDPLKRILTCPLSLKSHSKRMCPLHKRLDDAMAVIEDSFARTSLADLLVPGDSRPLCDSECAPPVRLIPLGAK